MDERARWHAIAVGHGVRLEDWPEIPEPPAPTTRRAITLGLLGALPPILVILGWLWWRSR